MHSQKLGVDGSVFTVTEQNSVNHKSVQGQPLDEAAQVINNTVQHIVK